MIPCEIHLQIRLYIMILGILSDTHGNLPRAEAAIQALRGRTIHHLIHCGDLGSEDIVTLLFEQKESGLPVTAVVGNVDEWNPDLILYAKKLGIPLPRTAQVNLGKLNMAVSHGHDPFAMDALLKDTTLNILFTGHTHVPRDEQVGNVRILNPGAIHRAEIPGFALFDTSTQSYTRLPL